MKYQQKIKRYAAMWQSVLLSIICLTTSCYSGAGGELHPQAGEGYSIVKKADGWEAARIVFDKASLRIDGSWDEGSVGNGFIIENNSDSPFIIDFAQVKMEILPEKADTLLFTIYDFSSSASKPEGETYDDGKLLYKYYGKEEKGVTKPIGDTKVSCPPRQKCIYSTVIVFPKHKLNKTKGIQITLPPTANRTEETKVIFNCRAKSLLDSLTARVKESDK